jgi:DNA invertase Pin-like site-specific DNA recombinase
LIRERVRAGMRRARLEGRQIGRARLDVDRLALMAHRRDGMSLSKIAEKHCISKAGVCRLLKKCNEIHPKALPSIEDLGLRAGL